MKNAYDTVRTARLASRPTSLDFISSMFTSFTELHGDRRYGDDKAIVGGIAFLKDIPVTVIGIEKGKNTRERILRSFGSPEPEGYRKALRLMRQAEKFHRPVVTFVDTSGAYCGIGAEKRGQGEAIAENLMEMSALNVPVVTILIGEGGSGGALALAVCDRLWMLENSIYSVISPEGCASILYRDAKRTDEAAAALRLTAEDALEFHFADRIISEEKLGSREFFAALSDELYEEIKQLSEIGNIRERRYERFRSF